MPKIIQIVILSLLIFGCKPTVDIEKQEAITDLSAQLFQKKTIDFLETLDLIKAHTDLKTTDSLTRIDNYINTSANIFFEVNESPNGIIKYMSYYVNNKEIYVAEYYDNGQIMCKFNTSKEGIRNGPFACYHKNGKPRILGKFKNNEKIGKEIGYDTLGQISYEFDYSNL